MDLRADVGIKLALSEGNSGDEGREPVVLEV